MPFATHAKHVVRGLLRRPGFSTLVIATLGLGIGGAVAVFTLVHAVLLESLPFPEADRLVSVGVRDAQTGFLVSMSVPNYHDWSQRNRAFSSMGAMAGWSFVRPTDEGAERVDGALVIGDFFGTLGLEPALGRLFTGEETERGAEPVAVLGYGFWQRAYGGDPEVLGRTLTLDGRPYAIAGVLPQGVGFPRPDIEAYVPMGVLADELPWDTRGDSFGTGAVARLAPGSTVAAAQRDMKRVTDEVDALEGRPFSEAVVEPLADRFLADVRVGLWVLLAGAGVLLAIACANVANLMLARGEGRHRELAVRAALGAGRGSSVRLLLGENVALTVVGGALGLALAAVLVRALPRALPVQIPALVAGRISLDGTVLVFVVGIVALSAVLAGLVPARRAARTAGRDDLRQGARTMGGRHGDRLRDGLVVAQVTLSLVLLVGAGLLVRSFRELAGVNKGFVSDDVLTAGLSIPRGTFSDRASWLSFYDGVREELAAEPGVEVAAASLLLPLSNRSWELRVLPDNVPYDPDTGESVLYDIVSTDYFQAMGIPLLSGRAFGAGDLPDGPPVAIIDERMAELFWPDENPVGRKISFERNRPAGGGEAEPVWRTVVGVVPNVRHYELGAPSRIQVYVPVHQSRANWGVGLSLVLKTRGAPLSANVIRRAVAAREPGVPVVRVRTLQSYVDDALSSSRALSALSTVFGGVAALMAALGVFGVLSLMVGRRRPEIGLRMAVGASPSQVRRMIARRGMALTAWGTVLGLGAAFAAARALGSLLFQVRPADPAVYATVILFMAVLALAASLLPALRASRTDPARILEESG